MKFDQDFPPDVDKELKKREKSVASKGIKWNYDKYAYCTIKSTGKSLTIIKAEDNLILGDGAAYNLSLIHI